MSEGRNARKRSGIAARHLGQRVLAIATHPGNRWRWFRAMARATQFRLAVARGEPVDLPYYRGTKLRCWPDSDTSRAVAYCAAAPDHDEMGFLEAFLRPGDAVLDAGANIGTYAVLAGALVGETGRVEAIEPVATTAGRLRDNVKLNGFESRVTVHEFAVGAEAGRSKMTTGLDATNHVLAASEDGATTTEVRVEQLDRVFTARQFAFGKLDIEGWEWEALRGAERMLAARSPPVWMVEINGALARYGHEPGAFFAWMGERGFDAATYSVRGRRLAFNRDPWNNVFFVARDRLGVLQERIPGLRLS